MLILLPPSETKRPGGDGPPIDFAMLALRELAPHRAAVVDALVSLSDDEEAAARVLKLSARQRGDIAANAALRTAPTMPAVDRYTGVLYDALDAASLDESARAWLGVHVMIQSAPFGLVGALDGIPSYRLAAGTSVPGIPALRRVWADPSSAALAEAAPSFVLDLRSEAYVALAPIPDALASAYVRVVADDGGGVTRALNHFNKKAKGALVRRLAHDRPRLSGSDAFLSWAADAGMEARHGGAGEIDLVV